MRSDAGTGPLQMLVLQATPFCPLACRYCYLPERDNRRVMDDATLNAIGRHVLQAPWAAREVKLVWHAGEPLALRPTYYDRAFAQLAASAAPGIQLRHKFQTSGIPLDAAWLDFLRAHPVEVGLSIDGPEWLHDRMRTTRTGRGTADRTMRALHRLQDAGLAPDVLTVLTDRTLDHADELFDFYVGHGISRVGFNLEEVVGANSSSSLHSAGAEARLEAFLRRFWTLCERTPGRLIVREFEAAAADVLGSAPSANPLVTPLYVITIGVDGSLSTYCPELMGAAPDAWHHFRFGNVRDGGPEILLEDPIFRQARIAIEDGIEACRSDCPYFRLCGGGAPSKKLFEHGRFNVSETQYCRLARRTVFDVVINGLESRVAPGSATFH